MAEAVVTTKARVKMLKARAGDTPLSPIVGFAFGNGGTDGDGNVLVPTESQESLGNELLRKEIDCYELKNETTCRYECTLLSHELAGTSISEVALYDSDGDLVAIKNFVPKDKDSELEMVFQIDDTF